MNEMDQHLKAVAEIVAVFLLENGGMSNGYETYAKGSVESGRRQSAHVDVMVPEYLDKTGRYMKGLGSKLGAAILKYMELNIRGLDQVRVDITATHFEHGVHRTGVSYAQQAEVQL